MESKKQMLKIALTGGLAAGKTLAAKTLADLGAYIIDADIVAREVTAEPEVADRIRQAFGERYFDKDGKLNRRKLGKYVFADPQRVKLLNSLLHPLIKQKIQDQLDCLQLPVVFVVAPLLIESGMVDMFDRVWTIASKPEIRIKRAIRRDNISRRRAYNILRNQATEQQRAEIASVVINNEDGEDEFIAQIKNHYRDLTRELGLT
ncbi:MAG TPA: dephospho-CoA kinase [Clostridiales bacterium]|jgi:dephospho-CoA kinase|nr:dephospho-CoA kinase [Clostridiales bacterium]